MTDSICECGRYRGKKYHRIPSKYLQAMISSDHPNKHHAIAEMKRRGKALSHVEVSMHAIDRASLRCLGVWKRTRNGKEGLGKWLSRMASDAIKNGEWEAPDRVVYGELVFGIADGLWPTVTTVMYRPAHQQGEDHEGN